MKLEKTTAATDINLYWILEMVFRRQFSQYFSALQDTVLKVCFKDVIETDRTWTLHLLSLILSLAIEAQVPYVYHIKYPYHTTERVHFLICNSLAMDY